MGKFLLKILGWFPLGISSILGMVQAAIKFIKEVITLIINIIFPLVPDTSKFEKIVLKVRDWINKIDEIFEKVKQALLSVTGING